jgi:hypothetical protein
MGQERPREYRLNVEDRKAKGAKKPQYSYVHKKIETDSTAWYKFEVLVIQLPIRKNQ